MLGGPSLTLALERLVRRLPPLRVTRREAIERGVTEWERLTGEATPIEVPLAREDLRSWKVWLCPSTSHGGPWMEVDGQTGEARNVWPLPLRTAPKDNDRS